MSKKIENMPSELADETERELAERVLQPTTLSASVLTGYIKERYKDADYDAIANELQRLTEPLKEGSLEHLESILFGQIKVLDAVWNKLIRLAREDSYGGNINFKYLEAAMKVQRRGCATAQTLAFMKKTNSFSVIQQQNTTNLQVNTGIPADQGKLLDGKTKIMAGEVLTVTDERHNHEILDPGRAAAAGKADSRMAAVETQYRPEDPRR